MHELTAAPPATNPTARHRVLIVDDEPLIRWWLAESLGDRGCDVTEADSACTALRVLSDEGAAMDLVLLDFRLPDSNDLTLLTRVLSLAPKAKVVLMTAHGSSEILQGALDHGAYRVVTKPFKVDDVAAIVSELDRQ